MCSSRDNFQESVFFYFVGPGIELGSKAWQHTGTGEMAL